MHVVAVGIYLYDIYNNSNVGIFCKASDDFLLIPQGYAKQKSERLAKLIKAEPVFASVGYTRLLGPLTLMNSHGMLVSRFATDEEINNLRNSTKIRIERFDSTYSSVGNLVSANDYGAIASNLVESRGIKQIEEVLKVKVLRTNIAGVTYVGSIVCASNNGAIIHPNASELEVKRVSEALNVDCEPGSINGGIPFVASGIVVNSKGAIVGTQTSGPELFILTKAFKL